MQSHDLRIILTGQPMSMNMFYHRDGAVHPYGQEQDRDGWPGDGADFPALNEAFPEHLKGRDAH